MPWQRQRKGRVDFDVTDDGRLWQMRMGTREIVSSDDEDDEEEEQKLKAQKEAEERAVLEKKQQEEERLRLQKIEEERNREKPISFKVRFRPSLVFDSVVLIGRWLPVSSMDGS